MLVSKIKEVVPRIKFSIIRLAW